VEIFLPAFNSLTDQELALNWLDIHIFAGLFRYYISNRSNLGKLSGVLFVGF